MNELTPLSRVNNSSQYNSLPNDEYGMQATPLGIVDETSSLASNEEDDEGNENQILLLNGHDDDNDDDDVNFDFYSEAKRLFDISLPTVGSQFCTFLIFPQTASIIGRHLDSEYLAAFSLGNLTGSLTTTSIIIGALTASETLQPRAFALGQYREVGLLAVRGFIICAISLALPIFLLLTKVNDVLDFLGEDIVASELASQWIKIFIWGVPSVLLFRTTQRFLACQNIVLPCLLGAAFGCFFVHPFVLKWAVGHYGFLGSAAALSVTQLLQAVASLIFIVVMKSSPSHRIEPRTWPGLSVSVVVDALQWDEMMNYANLSIGGIFALSEWWFWETICMIAGEFGMEALCVHSIAYQVIPITVMIPLGISIGLSVRMGALLPFSVYQAKKLAAYTTIFTTVVGTLVSIILYIFRDEIIYTFTTDEGVVEGCRKIWFNVCVFQALIFAFMVNCGILRALGLQWRMAATIIMVLWFGAVPIIFHFSVRQGGGLYQMWSILPLCYIVLNIGLIASYATVSWQGIADAINEKRAVEEAKGKI